MATSFSYSCASSLVVLLLRVVAHTTSPTRLTKGCFKHPEFIKVFFPPKRPKINPASQPACVCLSVCRSAFGVGSTTSTLGNLFSVLSKSRHPNTTIENGYNQRWEDEEGGTQKPKKMLFLLPVVVVVLLQHRQQQRRQRYAGITRRFER